MFPFSHIQVQTVDWKIKVGMQFLKDATSNKLVMKSWRVKIANVIKGVNIHVAKKIPTFTFLKGQWVQMKANNYYYSVPQGTYKWHSPATPT